MSLHPTPSTENLYDDVPVSMIPLRRVAQVNLNDEINFKHFGRGNSRSDDDADQIEHDSEIFGLTPGEIEEIENMLIPYTVEPLHPKFARWFYKLHGNEKTWTPFQGTDSLKIELRHRKLYEAGPYEFRRRVGNEEDLFAQVKEIGAAINTVAKSWAKDGYNLANKPLRKYFRFVREPVMDDEEVEDVDTDDPNNVGYLEQALKQFTPIPQHVIEENYEINFGPGESIEDRELSLNENSITIAGVRAAHRNLPNFGPQVEHNGENYLVPCPSLESGLDITTLPEETYPNSPASKSASPSGTGTESPNAKPRKKANDGEPEINPIVYVLSGVYEANLEDMSVSPSFWDDNAGDIRRGIWFDWSTWEPIDEAQAEEIENAYLGYYHGQLISDPENPIEEEQRVAILGTESESGSFAIISYSQHETYLIRDMKLLDLAKKSKNDSISCGVRLHRGYKKWAELHDSPKPIDHLVLVIHGIGQKNVPRKIAENTTSIRDNMEYLKTKYFKSIKKEHFKIELFPIQWRNTSNLDLVHEIIGSITPDHVKMIRGILNTTAMDVMYYISPVYRKIIQDSLRDEANRVYVAFTRRDPGFFKRNGKVSIIAHSLGAVITFDVAAGQHKKDIGIPLTLDKLIPLFQPEQSESDEARPEIPTNVSQPTNTNTKRKPYLNIKLPETNTFLFPINHFMAMGSPLAVFLALRWENPSSGLRPGFVLPHDICHRFYNIFHDSDPVSYRIEPLINRFYATLAPVPVEKCHDKEKVLSYDLVAHHCNPDVTQQKVKNLKELKTVQKVWEAFRDPAKALFSRNEPSTSTATNVFNAREAWSARNEPSTSTARNVFNTREAWSAGNEPATSTARNVFNTSEAWSAGNEPSTSTARNVFNAREAWKARNEPSTSTARDVFKTREAWSAESETLAAYRPRSFRTSNSLASEGLNVVLQSSEGRLEFRNDFNTNRRPYLSRRPRVNEQAPEVVNPSSIPDRLPYRMDYVLPRYVPFWCSHIYSIAAHMNYWDNSDAHYFIVKLFYQALDSPTAWELDSYKSYIFEMITSTVLDITGE